MNYILILGNSYRDCKEKLESIIKQDDVKYTFVTKTKHLKNIPFTDYIETNEFYNNSQKKEILNIVKDKLNIGNTSINKEPEYIEMDVSFDSSSLEEENDILEFNNKNIEDGIKSKDNEDIDEEINNDENELDEGNINTLDELEKYLENKDDQDNIEEHGIEDKIEEVEVNNKEIKPAGNPPRGWHARKEYIDEEGNIFNKGDYVGNVHNT